MRILVADDDATTRTWLAAHLPNWGHEVILCTDGLEARGLLGQEDPPDLAILSRDMNGMDGVAICREIRRIERQAYTYIILLTNESDEDGIVAGIEAGADDYVEKPLDSRELQIRIRSGCRIVRLQHDLLCALSALEFQAARDQLTGLWNRRGILGVLKSESARAVRRGSPVGVIVADLDELGELNATYGQPAGNALLRELAQRMTRAVRPYDAVGRVEGGKFVLVLPGCNEESTRLAAERLRSLVSEKIVSPEGVMSVTMSCGVVAASGKDIPEAEAMIERAGDAVSQAKNRGRNRVEVWHS